MQGDERYVTCATFRMNQTLTLTRVVPQTLNQRFLSSPGTFLLKMSTNQKGRA